MCVFVRKSICVSESVCTSALSHDQTKAFYCLGVCVCARECVRAREGVCV